MNQKRPHTVAPTSIPAVFLALVLAVLPAHGELAEPDHTIYGTPTFFGAPVAAGVLTLVLSGQTQPIASYEMGSDPQLVGLYALRVPLDSVGDRVASTARPGDRAKIFLDGQLAAEVTIGERGTVQLLDVDPELAPQPAMVSIADTAIVEDQIGPRGVELVISLSRTLDELVEVDWRTLDGTATAGADYQAGSGRAIFNPGETSVTVSIAVFDDGLIEADPSQRIVGETFQVELTQATAATLLASLATVTIVDDDTPPAFAIGNLTVVEPQSPGGTVAAALAVSLSHPWTQDVAVDYAAVDESATGAADFSLVPGRVTIPAGQVSAAITFEVFGDAEVESDETFRVELSNAAIASVLAGGGRATILEEARLLTFVERQTDGLLGIDGLAGAIAVAASPDGAHVYAAGRVDDAVAVFDRDAASGRLEPVAVYRDAAARSVGVIDALGGIEDVAVSPDGVHVVAAAYDDAAVSVFERAADGTLMLVEVEREDAGDGESGLVVDGLLGATAVAFDPAGDHLYVAGSQDHAVAVFGRQANGRLSFAEVVRDGAGGVDGLRGAADLAVSPDGAQLYVAGLDDDAVAVFDRDAVTGRLSFVEVHRDGVAGVDGLASAAAVAVAPDGTSVYAAGQDDDAVAVFDRDAVTGRLSFRQAIFNGTGGTDGLAFTTDVAVSHDGGYVYASGFLDDALAVFERAGDGSLSFLEVERDGVAGADGLNGVTALAVSGDDRHVYATGNVDHAAAVFHRDLSAPFDPGTVTSTSHAVGVFSPLTTIEVEWSGAADGVNGIGVAGYWVLFDETPDTLPPLGPPSVFVPQGLDPHSTASAVLADGAGHYFHLRTCDFGDHCTATVHLGPLLVDGTPPDSPPALASPSHGAGVPSSDTTIEVTWLAAVDATSGIDGYSWEFNQAATWTCGAKLGEATQLAVTSGNLAAGAWYFHACSVDVAGNVSAVATIGPFVVDLTADLTLASPSHTPSSWSADATVDASWSQSGNPAGVSGYSFVFTTDPATEPDEVIDLPRGADPHLTTSPTLADGADHYFHLRICGTSGGCAPAVHLGPFGIDATAPSAVAGLAATTHAPSVASNRPELGIEWDAAADVASGVAGYGVEINDQSSWVCDQVSDTGESTSTWTSPTLADGTWWAHVCAVDRAGNWSAVATAGPFLVDAAFRASNRLLNPEFDDGLSSWLLVHTVPNEILWTSDDVHGLTASGAAALTVLDTDRQPVAVAQCVVFPAETDYLLRAQARIAVISGSDPIAFGSVEFFSSADCTGDPLAVELSSTVTGDTAGQWPLLELEALSAPGTASVLVTFAAQGQRPASGEFTADVDHVFFGQSVVIFTDGFESGQTSAWSSTVP